MKITTFDPLILTSKADDTIKVFEDLGFERRHKNEEVEGIEGIRMADPNGFHVDVASRDGVQQDKMVIRMNVDDFDEAYQKLLARGFKNVNGDHVIRTDYSVSTVMLAPSGFAINLIHHIRKEDI